MMTAAQSREARRQPRLTIRAEYVRCTSTQHNYSQSLQYQSDHCPCESIRAHGESTHHALPARAADALTTPPASRLGLPNARRSAASGAAWIALGARTFDAARRATRWARSASRPPRSRTTSASRPPGFLELTSPLFVLQGVLLLALSANVFESKDAARVSSSIALASGTTLLALALAVVAGAPVENGIRIHHRSLVYHGGGRTQGRGFH